MGCSDDCGKEWWVWGVVSGCGGIWELVCRVV